LGAKNTQLGTILDIMFRRSAPALVLFVLTPLVAEYLLGDLLLSQLAIVLVLAPLYGAGAVFIRELARRNGRGWPTILTLALAYGLLEEGFATQSLFNPHYLGLRLLDYGFIPTLGISSTWTVFVLSLHVAWSIGVPIALTELLFRERRTEPWLGNFGFYGFTLLFVLGVVMVGVHTAKAEHFIASRAQFVVTGLLMVLVSAAAFYLFSAKHDGTQETASSGCAPNPWLLGLAVFAAGSTFELTARLAPQLHLSAHLAVISMLGLEAGVVVLSAWSSRRKGWSDEHRFALAAGGLLVYCWWGYLIQKDLHPSAGVAGHSVFAIAAVGLLISLGLNIRQRPSS
jgi:hypothetical protein